MLDGMRYAAALIGVDAMRVKDEVLAKLREEEGSTTVEYAIGAVATAGFAGLLLVVLKSGAVKGLLQGLIETALSL